VALPAFACRTPLLQQSTDFCQTNYLNICLIDIRRIFSFGRTSAVYDESEISFSIFQGMMPWQRIFFWFCPHRMI